MQRVLILLLVVLLAGCAKSSQELKQDLWQNWELVDELQERNYPDAPPVVLIHGWNGGEFSWATPARLKAFEQKLGRDIYFFTYRTSILLDRYPPIELLEEKLERLLSSLGEVDVIAHSMGGLLLRQYLTHHPDHEIERVVFLAVPHYGTDAAILLANLAEVNPTGNIQAEELRPGSTFLWRLNQFYGRELKGIDVLNVYVSSEQSVVGDIVVDPHSAYLHGVRNLIVAGDHHLGHRVDELKDVVQFLSGQGVQAISDMPARRDIWIRVKSVSDESYIALTPSFVRRVSPEGRVVHAGVTTCCGNLSALRDEGGTTLLIENVQEGEQIELVFRHTDGSKSVVLELPDIDLVPVTLIEVVEP